MSFTAPQLQAIIDQAVAESGGKFHPFDPVFYANTYPGSIDAWKVLPGNASKSLLDHFVEVGAAQGFFTSPAFDPQFYLAQWPDLQSAALAGTDLLAHWITHGIAEGRAATALLAMFDGARYLARYPDVAAYVNAHVGDFLGSVSNGAEAHFVKFGHAEGREAFSLSGAPIILPDLGLIEEPEPPPPVTPPPITPDPDAGQTLTGTSANQSTLAPGTWINGDDLLFGGKGNDTLIGKTGDDRFIMSAGTDTVYGDNQDGTGAFDLLADGTTKQFYQDVLQAEEATFGIGTRFTVTRDSTEAGKGVLQALDSTGAVLATTNFSGIELVRALENNRGSSLDLKALSDTTCVAIGDNSLPEEGLYVFMTKAPATFTLIDKNGDGDTKDSDESTPITAVLGTENLTTGNSPDFVTLDQTQASASNVLDLGAQQDNTVLATLRESADIVTYDQKDINNDGVVDAKDVTARPTLTVAVLGASSSTVGETAGALGSKVVIDTLKNVEIVDVTDAATSGRFNDTLDVSALAGATVNFGTAPDTIAKSLGGQVAAPTTVAQVDGNTLDGGGVALSSAPSAELLTIRGIQFLEKVVGSASDDRVIVGDKLQAIGLDFSANGGKNLTAQRLPVQSSLNYVAATGVLKANTVAGGGATVADQGLYTFNLGAGSNDMLDYHSELGPVTVIVDSSAANTDLVLVDARADFATGVERYFGNGAGSVNAIDLVAQTTPTTIQFSKEAKSNSTPNEFTDPAGSNPAGTTDLTRGIQVRSSTDSTAVYATFMDRTGTNNVPGYGAAFWTRVIGSDAAENVILTKNESATVHTFDLRGGKNIVDYSALSTPLTVAIGKVDTTVAGLLQTTTVPVANDTITDTRAAGPLTDTLTIIAGTGSDTVDIGLLLAGGATRVQITPGTDIAPTSFVDPRINVVNLGAGVVTEAVFGQFAPGKAAAFQTFISGFENATNATGVNVAHLLGNDGVNALTAGIFGDLIYGAGGGDSSGVLQAVGSRGDSLTAGLGKDLFLYKGEAESPNGLPTINQNPLIFGVGAAGAINIANSADTITGFTVGTDKLVFVVSDEADAVQVTGAIPAVLTVPLNSIAPVTELAAAGNLKVDIPLDVAAVDAFARFDNYNIDFLAPLAAPAPADTILRVNATSGGDTIDASEGTFLGNLNAAAADLFEVDIVYTAAGQSQNGGVDNIIHFRPAGPVPGAPGDKIDLSFLQLPRYESSHAATGIDYDTNDDNFVDATQLLFGAVQNLPAVPVIVANGSSPGIFLSGGVYRPIAIQEQGTAPNQGLAVFIDVNGDANYDPAVDMVVSLIGSAGFANPVSSADFIFDQYGGGWGG